MKLQYLEVRGRKGIETAFRAARKEQAEAVLYLVAGLVDAGQQTEITELAVRSRLPTIYKSQQYVEAGGLVSYGVNTADLDRRAAAYVDKILKGAKPADQKRFHGQNVAWNGFFRGVAVNNFWKPIAATGSI